MTRRAPWLNGSEPTRSSLSTFGYHRFAIDMRHTSQCVSPKVSVLRFRALAFDAPKRSGPIAELWTQLGVQIYCDVLLVVVKSKAASFTKHSQVHQNDVRNSISGLDMAGKPHFSARTMVLYPLSTVHKARTTLLRNISSACFPLYRDGTGG